MAPDNVKASRDSTFTGHILSVPDDATFAKGRILTYPTIFFCFIRMSGFSLFKRDTVVILLTFGKIGTLIFCLQYFKKLYLVH